MYAFPYLPAAHSSFPNLPEENSTLSNLYTTPNNSYPLKSPIISTMAKLAVTVTFIFFFIAVIYARSPLDLPESNNNPSILLPTEKPESDPKPKTIESGEELPSSETYIVDRVTLTRPASFVSFRPINRHFNVQRQFGLRLPLRRCRHHKKAMERRFHGREVSYGNDMILSGDGSGSDQAFRGVVRQIPAKWVRFHHHHRHHDHDGLPEFPSEQQMFGKEQYKRHFHHYHHEEEKREEGGFMKKIRKFLNHF